MASMEDASNCIAAYEYYGYGDDMVKHIEYVTTKADDVQRRVLSEILTRNANVEYLQRYGLGSSEAHHDYETFKKQVPVVKYEDLRPYFQRIANGDTSPILCSQPIVEFLASSGTSGGERKLYPITIHEQERRSIFTGLVQPVLTHYIRDLEKGKGMFYVSVRADMTMASGLVARTAICSRLKNKHFKVNHFTQNTSLKEAILCPDPFQSMYSQMLCGLYQNREVIWLGTTFALAFIHAIKFVEKHWELLCHDIRTGSINQIITDTNVREAVMAVLLKPDPSLADFIESECSKVSGEGIVTRLWPNAKFVYSIVTGTMAQYIPTLDYYSSSLPIVSTIYNSSESALGINLNPLCKPSDVAYTIIPTMAYFEFLPVNYDGDEGEELVDLVDVKLDHEYEIVVTTYSGLYRYCVGDILRVTGFKNKAPQFQFVSRKNVVLSIDCDKTNEAELQSAVKNAANHLVPFDASLLDYTSYADISTIPGHYVLFWEIISRNGRDSVAQVIPASVLEDCCLTMEESLGYVYREARASCVGALEIRVVETGTFDKLMEYATTKGAASLSQYKTPRSVKDAAMIELLNSKVISRYLSPKCPNWAPVISKEVTS